MSALAPDRRLSGHRMSPFDCSMRSPHNGRPQCRMLRSSHSRHIAPLLLYDSVHRRLLFVMQIYFHFALAHCYLNSSNLCSVSRRVLGRSSSDFFFSAKGFGPDAFGSANFGRLRIRAGHPPVARRGEVFVPEFSFPALESEEHRTSFQREIPVE